MLVFHFIPAIHKCINLWVVWWDLTFFEPKNLCFLNGQAELNLKCNVKGSKQLYYTKNWNPRRLNPEIGKFKNKFQIKVIRFWIIWRDTSSFTSSSTLKYANIVDGCIPFGEIAKHIDCIHGKAMLHLESHFCNLHHYKIRSFALKCICICMCALSVCALWLESIFITFAVCHQPTKPKQPTDRVHVRTHTC